MKLFLVQRTDEWDYEEYNSMIVAAKNENEARDMHPRYTYQTKDEVIENDSWVNEDNKSSLKIKLIGTAKKGTKKEVILRSYNAG